MLEVHSGCAECQVLHSNLLSLATACLSLLALFMEKAWWLPEGAFLHVWVPQEVSLRSYET